jgi:purine-nucleoside phosphorylase
VAWPTISSIPSRSRSRAARLAAATAPGTSGGCCSDARRRPVVMLQGRFHLYEGNDPGLVVQPVLLFQRLGRRIVVLTNAAGGLDPSFGPGRSWSCATTST